ncbi:HET-domain-containing protein [Polyplosphaeria fusca]|uniref:HET-domain-containing protein n=1 Tax=Polyplosphaeria fusca TaxID=682080 RepID=A0A9P4UWD3_9PLEO|nr:HET-domain-containing protein [Polyplosphaeria fusca]
MPPPTYEYSPLSPPRHIRLVTIHPGRELQVSCSLSHTPLDNAPRYEALSYAWGDPTCSETMLLDGELLPITSSLAAALLALRDSRCERTMWIDAICINQADDFERSEQVCIMSSIYRQSQRTIVWIGEEREDSERAIAFLNEMGQYSSSPQLKGDYGTGFQNEPGWGHIMLGFPIMYGDGRNRFTGTEYLEDWDTVDALLARPWWSRAWVVQEVWNSARVVLQCGSTTLAWDLFERAMDYHEAWDDIGRCVKDHNRRSKWPFLRRRYSLAIHIARKRLYKSTLSDLLWNTWDREATDPRDKVFAVLGLVGNEAHGIRPDYNQTMVQVYCRTTKHIIREEQSLDILLAANGIQRGDGLPSWVPDWRKEANATKPALFVNRDRLNLRYDTGSMEMALVHGHGYRAAGDAPPSYAFDSEGMRITVSAIIIDTVQAVDEAYGESTPAGKLVSSALATVAECRAQHIIYTPGEIVIVLAAGGAESSKNEDDVLEGNMRLRRFFLTRNQRAGVGPNDMMVGDDVVLIAGCNFPMIVRREDDHYGLVGEAYVHVIMQGAAVPVGARWKDMEIW